MSATTAFPLGAALSLAELEHDPHPALARLRAAEPVSWVPALGGWLVTRHDLALAVLRDPVTYTVQDERFSTAQVLGPSMLSLDGAEHARHRTPFVAPFRPGAVRERFTAAVEAECAALLDELAPAGGCELRGQFAGPLVTRVLARALGLAGAEADAVRGWYEAIVAAVTELTAGRALPAAGAAAQRALAARLSAVLERPDGDSVLGAAAGAGTLSAAELISNAGVLLFGGIETTEATIANAVLYLLSEPAPLAPEQLDPLLEESLRLEPAAAMLDRYATRGSELAGVAIAAGELVRVSVAAAGRDPAVFAEPDRLIVDPPRPPRHLAFAQGPHVCLGVHLARVEARTALAMLTERFPRLRLARPAAVRGLVFRKPPELWVGWD